MWHSEYATLFFYMKILITGSGGFIGSKVMDDLRKKGHDVRGFDILTGDDLLNLDCVERAIKEVDVVFHIAAQADLTKMTANPDVGRDGVLKNVEGTHNVSYVCAKQSKWLIYASTVCVYGNLDKHPAIEDETLPNPSDLYACSKYAGEWIVRGYGKNYDMPWTILRFATIYGPGMRKALGLHVFFSQALRNEPITVHGDGAQERTLTFIDDLVEGIVAPLENPENAKCQVFNLSQKEAVSAIRMAEDVKRITGSASEIVFIEQRNNQTILEDVDVSKSKRLLDWEARTAWDEGLLKTYNWIKNEI